MSNPIAEILPIEERSDGVYLKVTRRQRDSIEINQIQRVLNEARVINYDIDQIRDVIDRARGGFEKISPPFEYYDPHLEKHVEVTLHGMSATMRIDAAIEQDAVNLTASGLLYCLRRKGVKCGIKQEVIKDFLLKPIYDEEILIAQGVKPKPGADARIEFEIRINSDARPTNSGGSRVDYRNIQTFSAVKEGSVIARRIPPEPGKSGLTVTGEPVDAPMGKDLALPKGKNTRINEDNTQLIAEKTGIICSEGSIVHVEELLSVKGDVDYGVGNIKYTGNVLISGNVHPGFSVETEGDIHIAGDVESARVISRNGMVTIDKGIIGKGDTYVYGKEGVHVGFAQEANLNTDGVLTVEKYILHCECCCNEFKAAKHNTGVIGGILKAYKSIDAGNIGNEKGISTVVSIVNKIKIVAENRILELHKLKEKIAAQMDPITREVKAKTAIMRKAGEMVTDVHRRELKKVIMQYTNLSNKIKYVDKKIQQMQELLQKPSTYEGYVSVQGTAYQTAEIDLYGMGHKVIHLPVTKKVFKLHDGAIQAEGSDGI